MRHITRRTSLIRRLQCRFNRQPKGQSIILIALALVGVISFVGLAIDVGLVYIGYGNLRRAVDSAALAAATQYREGWSESDLENSAKEFLALNDVNDPSATIKLCIDDPSDTELCTTPKRKLIRVTGSTEIELAFLRILGFSTVHLTSTAVGEAAAMDVVLVLDISESMTWDVDKCDSTSHYANVTIDSDCQMRNPQLCNATDDCHPFEEVKSAAANFAKWVLDNKNGADNEEDRLAIVYFSNSWSGQYDEASGTMNESITQSGTGLLVNSLNSAWFTDQTEAVTAINDLKVFEPADCPILYDSGDDLAQIEAPGTCIVKKTGDVYLSQLCPYKFSDNPISSLVGGDQSTCGTTDIGSGLYLAGSMFKKDSRPSALWITILLTDGAANATPLDDSDYTKTASAVDFPDSLPWGFCPEDTNIHPGITDSDLLESIWYCQDLDANTSHTSSSSDYNADDYARDAARFVACDPTDPADGCNDIKGQGALMYAIGLGKAVLSPTDPDTGDLLDLGGSSEVDQNGDSFLRFVSAVGDDGDPESDTEPCDYSYLGHQAATVTSFQCGNYYYRRDGSSLEGVFDDIADRIFTRLSH